MSNSQKEDPKKKPLPTSEPLEWLIGIEKIAAHIHRTDFEVLRLSRLENFPAADVGGLWVAEKGAVEEWRRLRVLGKDHLKKEWEAWTKDQWAARGKA